MTLFSLSCPHQHPSGPRGRPHAPRRQGTSFPVSAGELNHGRHGRLTEEVGDLLGHEPDLVQLPRHDPELHQVERRERSRRHHPVDLLLAAGTAPRGSGVGGVGGRGVGGPQPRGPRHSRVHVVEPLLQAEEPHEGRLELVPDHEDGEDGERVADKVQLDDLEEDGLEVDGLVPGAGLQGPAPPLRLGPVLGGTRGGGGRGHLAPDEGLVEARGVLELRPRRALGIEGHAVVLEGAHGP